MPISRKQLLLPFLSAVADAGGAIASRVAYDPFSSPRKPRFFRPGIGAFVE